MLGIAKSKQIDLGNILNDPKRPLIERFRALFALKYAGGRVAIEEIGKCFVDTSVLLKHELAYCLGQMQDPHGIPILIEILKNVKQEPMVRHEAGEALGAIGDDNVLPILEEYSDDPIIEVAETCQLATRRIKWLKSLQGKKDNLSKNPYETVDPAPPAETRSVDELKSLLMDERAPIFERYRAMFALRNLRTRESVLALCQGLKARSALFRHEVAFVLGQLQEEVSVPHLIELLQKPSEHEMVRHECAEALGAIATPECVDILRKYHNDENRVVSESCIIALDMCVYKLSSEFEYANVLSGASA